MAFSGQDGFIWAIGVVEDRFDPEKLGRVRVRWLGYHTEEKEKILTKDLPWAQVMQPASGGTMAGIGESPVNLVEGTWVCGFFKDTSWMTDAVVIGTLPGNNVTTALTGEGSKKWGRSRGQYTEFQQTQTYANNEETIPGSEETYSDYQYGFFDPTVEESEVPHPPSELTFRSLTAKIEQKYIEFSYLKHDLFPRVLNWSPENSEKKNPEDVWDLITDPATPGAGTKEALSEIINPQLWTNSPPLMEIGPISTSRITHTDILHAMFYTTRRVVSDARLPTSWTKMGTMRWPDTMTYSKDGTEFEPGFRIGEPEGNPGSLSANLVDFYERLKGVDRENYIITTGYLEDGFWRDVDTDTPSYPWTRDRAVVSNDSDAKYTDTRFASGQGTETGQFGLTTESYRVTHPRVKYVKKKDLTDTQAAQAEELYDSGYYGSGIYEMDDPENGRKDIKWDDVKEDDLVIVQTPDMNPLAMGGIPITSISGNTVTTQSGFFVTAERSIGANAKPEIAKGDIIQIAGVRGMQEVNGRVFEVLSVSGTDSLTITLGTKDGTVWTGPTLNQTGKAIDTAEFSPYINGGVVLVDPHPVLQWKADIRERQVNIGSPNPETGLNAKHWNQPTSDFNAQYPYNQVYESESGHIKEFDDTPGAERIHEYHRAGTYYEVDHAGNKTDYVKGDRYNISMHDDYVYVKGRVVHTYDDEVLIRANDRVDLSAKWKMQIWSGGDLEIHSKRNISMKSDGDINLQADGHINLQGTTLTPAQAEFKAGTRGKYEMSKIRMRAGHLEAEMIGDELHPDMMGIALQSNIAPIQIKTVHEGKSIFVTSAEDIELFANTDFYRTAWTGKMLDYAYTDYNLTAITGKLELLAAGTDNLAAESGAAPNYGTVFITGKQQVNIEACKDDLNLTAGWKDINIFAKCASTPAEPNGGNINIEAKSNAQPNTGIISMHSEDKFNVKTDNSTEWESLKKIIVKSTEDMQYTPTAKYQLNAGGDVEMHSGGTFYIDGSPRVDINKPGPTITNITPTIPTVPDEAGISSVSKPAYIAETLTLIVTDLPNPVPADPPLIDVDSHGLALNANNTTGGGGENIRNLQDLIAEIDAGSGIVHHTLKPSIDVGKQVLTGDATTTIAGIWDGYSDELEGTAYILGKRAFSSIRRFHGWTQDGDTASSKEVSWKCLVDSTRP